MKTMISSLLLVAFFGVLPTARAEHGVSLETKLTLQFARYESAQRLLLERLREGGRVSRDEWESWLAATGPDAFTAEDLASLKDSQRQRIAAARARAVLASAFDLDALRGRPEEIKRFCAALPKGGMVHIHPSGTLTRATSRALLTARDPVLPLEDMAADFSDPSNHFLLYPEELTWFRGLGRDRRFSLLSPADQTRYVDFFVLPPGNHPFERFDSVFPFVGTAISEWDDYSSAIMDFARRASAQGVLYVEFRTGVSASSLPRFDALLRRIEAETGLVVRIDRSFNRTSTEAQRASALADLLSLPENPWVVGIDLLGNERNAPALETAQVVYGTVLQAVLDGRSRLHRTMHAGEIGDPRDARDAMIMGSERLGHGVLLEKDPVALEYATRQGVPIEINLVSNLRLEAVPSLEAHPYLDFLRLGSPTSLSTDDEGIFETDIDNECRVAIEHTDVTYAELKQMARNALATGFLAAADKERLLARLDAQFRAFERHERLNPAFQRAAGF